MVLPFSLCSLWSTTKRKGVSVFQREGKGMQKKQIVKQQVINEKGEGS